MGSTPRTCGKKTLEAALCEGVCCKSRIALDLEAAAGQKLAESHCRYSDCENTNVTRGLQKKRAMLVQVNSVAMKYGEVVVR